MYQEIGEIKFGVRDKVANVKCQIKIKLKLYFGDTIFGILSVPLAFAIILSVFRELYW